MKNKLLIIIIIFFIIAMLYSLWQMYSIYNPAQKQLNAYTDMYNSMMDNFRIEDSIRSERMDYINRINEVNFRTRLNQEEIISILYNCALKNNIYILDIKFAETEEVAENIDIVQSGEASVCETMCAAAEFKSDFEGLLGFIDDIKGYGDISVTNLNVSVWEEDIMHAFVQMKFYAVPVEILL